MEQKSNKIVLLNKFLFVHNLSLKTKTDAIFNKNLNWKLILEEDVF